MPGTGVMARTGANAGDRGMQETGMPGTGGCQGPGDARNRRAQERNVIMADLAWPDLSPILRSHERAAILTWALPGQDGR